MPETASVSQGALRGSGADTSTCASSSNGIQWKQVRTVLGDTNFPEETRPIHVVEEDRSVSLADSAMHAY